MATSHDGPDVEAGLAYWKQTPATVDGVLGGFGNGSLPRVDALCSRQFLQTCLPYLNKVPSALAPIDLSTITPSRRIRALEVGAGIGRVTSKVLLPLMDDVVMLEPIGEFVEEAIKASAAGTWKGIRTEGSTKSVTFLTGPLQSFDPTIPVENQVSLSPKRVGISADIDGTEGGYDVIWCQWTLGHLSDEDLVTFFKRSSRSLRKSPTGNARDTGLIVVKENHCREASDGKPSIEFDPTDSSVTRSRLKWLEIFKAAGLTIVKEKIQEGFPQGLYEVRMFALR